MRFDAKRAIESVKKEQAQRRLAPALRRLYEIWDKDHPHRARHDVRALVSNRYLDREQA